MKELNINEYSEKVMKDWIDNQSTGGRSFPDYRDGLKNATRAILEATFKATKGGKLRAKMNEVLGEVSNIKDGSMLNNQQISYRMSLSEYPLIKPANAALGEAGWTIDILTGFESRSDYMELNMTTLGMYVMKYNKYFTKIQSKVDSTKWMWEYIRTPLPLSLVIPQSNLADGVSNDAPNLNIVEVINAFVEHIKKDKKTTTQDLANHISGIGLGDGNIKLYTNQTIHDMIEIGIGKVTELSQVKFHKDVFLIQGLPYKTFGKTLHKDFNALYEKGLRGDPKGLLTFEMTANSMEGSSDSYITVGFKLRPGSTLEDMKTELFKKTRLRKGMTYRNIVNDFKAPKSSQLTIMSIREILDYHYDEALELKRLEVQDDIEALELRFGDAKFMEKVTKKYVASIISSLSIYPNKRDLALQYLRDASKVFKEYLNGNHAILQYYPQIRQVVEDGVVEIQKDFDTSLHERFETINDLIDFELPNEWESTEIRKVYTEEFAVLYKLDKRDEFIRIIEQFKEDFERMHKRLEVPNLKNEIIEELEALKSRFIDSKTNNYIARPLHERERMKQLRRSAMKELKRIPQELPVNVLVSSDGFARLSFSATDDLPNLQHVFQASNQDYLVVVNREGNSFNIPVSKLTIEPQRVFNPDTNVLVTIRNSEYSMGRKMILVTNRGRISCINDTALKFTTKEVRTSLDENEYYVYAKYLTDEDIERRRVVVMKDSSNQYKGIYIHDLSVKNTLIEMYNMYAGDYTTESIDTVGILDFDATTFMLWKDGWNISYVAKLRCRNVSAPIKNPLDISGQFTNGRVLCWGNKRAVFDYYGVTGEGGFETIYPPFTLQTAQDSDSQIEITSLSDLRIINTETTTIRSRIRQFSPSEIQLNMILSKYKGG